MGRDKQIEVKRAENVAVALSRKWRAQELEHVELEIGGQKIGVWEFTG